MIRGATPPGAEEWLQWLPRWSTDQTFSGVGIFEGLIYDRQYIAYYIDGYNIQIVLDNANHPYLFDVGLNRMVNPGLNRTGWVGLLKTALGLGDEYIDAGIMRTDNLARARVNFMIPDVL